MGPISLFGPDATRLAGSLYGPVTKPDASKGPFEPAVSSWWFVEAWGGVLVITAIRPTLQEPSKILTNSPSP
jgi:hypothetical protein